MTFSPGSQTEPYRRYEAVREILAGHWSILAGILSMLTRHVVFLSSLQLGRLVMAWLSTGQLQAPVPLYEPGQNSDDR
jgi:hypothetical protein